ncbi:alpha-hydroxy-acid oxidizing protein [Asaia bogorensis]|uniref:alpha-hydroxy-acid oxidizing protein n=1 Tax=Asaia bogorensis TaxID=91915 RepID=UPI000EFD4669
MVISCSSVCARSNLSPFLYAACLGGEASIRHAIGLLQRELHTDMSLMGVSSCEALRKEMCI